ncbi:MAG: L-threonylcarbamoyladenylate synthase [Nanoarchaeota archaeon]
MTLEISMEIVIKTKKEMIEKIKSGDVFIYPTDTVYGLGCDATNAHSVQRIKDIKCSDHPFSVIAPSLEWIDKNLTVSHVEFLKRLPGPYTLIMKKKKPGDMIWVSENDKLGIRIPMHPFTDIIQASGKPFVTTSLNISGKKVLTDLKDLTKSMVESVDVIIDAGLLNNPSSEIFDLSGANIKKIR